MRNEVAEKVETWYMLTTLSGNFQRAASERRLPYPHALQSLTFPKPFNDKVLCLHTSCQLEFGSPYVRFLEGQVTRYLLSAHALTNVLRSHNLIRGLR